MRIANLKGRLTLLGEHGAIDVERASNGKFTSDPQAVYPRWREFREWAAGKASERGTPVVESELLAPSPRPIQVFGIGLNYRAHAAEAGLPTPDRPATFTKFPTCLTGPFADVTLPSANVDWEVELVAVIGVKAHRVSAEKGWDHVAGLTVGQDISERVVQWGGGGQFSLGKSFPGFGPTGPWVVTPDELANPDDLELGCKVNDEVMQSSRTSDMVFSVPRLVAELSAILPLMPGDLIFTGTPAGVGAVRKPPRFLKPGDVVTSHIEGIGTIRNRMLPAAA
jgi:2-keto-4-pentenoate hydratase/2-oxohepta-3-ene-1,7-dioic acid hydratase in catechol pathway